MLIEVVIGGALILTTSVVHWIATLVGTYWVRRQYETPCAKTSSVHDSLVIAAFVLGLFLTTVIEVWLWAGVYLYLDALQTLEEALYFSTVTFTTLGFGDVVLDKTWRLLSSFEAANGLFLFGWSTALVFTVVQRLDFLRTSRHSDRNDA